MGPDAAQVEIAVLQPSLLADLDVLVDRERQGSRRAEHVDLVGDDFDVAGGQVGVGVALRAGRHGAGDLDAVLAAQAVGHGLVAHHHLHDAAGLAEIEERHSAVVAALGHPPGEGDGLADVLGAEGAGVMGANHCCSLIETCGRRSSSGGVQVAGSAAACSPDRMSLTSWVPSAFANHTNGMPRRSA